MVRTANPFIQASTWEKVTQTFNGGGEGKAGAARWGSRCRTGMAEGPDPGYQEAEKSARTVPLQGPPGHWANHVLHLLHDA